MPAEFNNWLESTLLKTRRVVEDSDRKAFADQALLKLIRELHGVLLTNALRAERPIIKREQTEETVTLSVEWQDEESGWWVAFLVTRRIGEKVRRVVEFSSESQQYALTEPSAEQIREALYKYFENWKRGR